ncbi:MAG: extracellular solute-binding protein [Rhodospirillaceae bacterium]|nr:extracellular solute-binding protein [Rhodospirillaceae bacterium]
MTEPTPEPQSKTNAEATARRSTAFGTFLLAAFLSSSLLALLAAYLLLAPAPIARPEASTPTPQAVADPAMKNVITLVAPRSVIMPDLLADFEIEAGLRIELISYDNEEALLGAAAGTSLSADVIVASGTTIKRLGAQSRLGVLPARVIASLGQVDPALRNLATAYDPGGLSAVPFAWTTIGLGFNREAVTQRLGNANLDSWSLLFDPVQAAKLKDCGIRSIDAPSAAFPAALMSLGLAPNADTPADTERASAVLETMRASVAGFDTRTVGDALATGQACLVMAAASDIYRARNDSRDNAMPFSVQFIIPREGAMLRLYMLAESRAVKNAAGGAALIDYLLKPEVSARMTNSRWIANAIPASQLYIRQEIKDDPGLYPDVGAFSRLWAEQTPSQATVKLRERFWQLISVSPPAP